SKSHILFNHGAPSSIEDYRPGPSVPAVTSQLRLARMASRAPSFCNIGMTRGNAITAGGKDEGLPLIVFILLHLTHQDYVVATVILSNLAAEELGDRAMKKRNPSRSFLKFDSNKLVGQRSGELPRKMVLARLQNVHRKKSGIG